MNDKKQVIDVHCHLFFLDYVIKEFYEIVKAMEDGSYPADWDLIENFLKGMSGDSEFIGRLKNEEKDFLTHVVNIGIDAANKEINGGINHALGALGKWVYTFFEKEQETLKILDTLNDFISWETVFWDIYQENAKKVWNTTQEVIVAPKMMDVYYMFAKPATKTENPATTPAPNMEELDIESVIANVSSFVAESLTAIEEYGKDPLSLIVDAVGFLFDRRDMECFTTDGFRHQWGRILDLKEQKEGLVYPFFAVDPRRPNIVEEVKAGVGPDKDFHGIKLYPRLGYHPQTPVLMEIFKYASENDIPITYHSSTGGFPPETIGNFEWPHGDFTSPKNWEPIFAQYNNLRVNFAHFSYSGEDKAKSKEWRDTIVGLMEKYPNVYTDISCYVAEASAKEAKEYFDANKVIQERMMFGSDFNITAAVGTWLEDYMKLWKQEGGTVFNAQEMEKLSQVNTANFLNLN